MTLCYMDDAVDKADQKLFHYIRNNYPRIAVSYCEESVCVEVALSNRIGDALDKRVADCKERCKNIGHLRKAILSEYVRNAKFESAYIH